MNRQQARFPFMTMFPNGPRRPFRRLPNEKENGEKQTHLHGVATASPWSRAVPEAWNIIGESTWRTVS